MIKPKSEYDSTYSIAYDILTKIDAAGLSNNNGNNSSNNNGSTATCQCSGNADVLEAIQEIRTDIEGRTIIQEKVIEKPVEIVKEVVKEKIVEKPVTIVKEKIIEKVEIRYIKDGQTVSTEVEYRPQKETKPCTCVCRKSYKHSSIIFKRVIPAREKPKISEREKREQKKKQQELINDYKRITGIQETNIEKIHEFMEKHKIKDLSKIRVTRYYHSQAIPEHLDRCIFLPSGRYAEIQGR